MHKIVLKLGISYQEIQNEYIKLQNLFLFLWKWSKKLRLALEGKAGKEIPESSRFEFLEMISENNLALSDGYI